MKRCRTNWERRAGGVHPKQSNNMMFCESAEERVAGADGARY